MFSCIFVFSLGNSILAQIKYQKDTFSVLEKSNQKKPSLFSTLDKTFGPPDALAIDRNGALFLSVPNFFNFGKHSAKICKFNTSNQPFTWLDSLPKHPETKGVFPMGMDFGSDGNLYIVDSQSSDEKSYRSRLIRVIVKNGLPVKTEILVEGMHSANGLRCYKDKIYISDPFFNIEQKQDQSAIFCFSIEELNKGLVKIKPDTLDPHVLCMFTTKVFENKKNQGGVDGLTFDSEGNLYAGNFGDGVISKIELSSDGKVKSQRIIVDSEKLRCCDGMYYYKKTNSIYIANFNNNSIHVLNLNTKELSMLWQNDDDGGETGLLDQPCDPIIYRGKLVIVNFDASPKLKNGTEDKFNTISIIDLNK